jgi:hypothetical protein
MSDVSAGAVLTLVVPLSLLVVVLALWALRGRRWLQLGGRAAGKGLPETPPDS